MVAKTVPKWPKIGKKLQKCFQNGSKWGPHGLWGPVWIRERSQAASGQQNLAHLGPKIQKVIFLGEKQVDETLKIPKTDSLGEKAPAGWSPGRQSFEISRNAFSGGKKPLRAGHQADKAYVYVQKIRVSVSRK